MDEALVAVQIRQGGLGETGALRHAGGDGVPFR